MSISEKCYNSHMYISILGRQPALGIAELESLYGSKVLTPLDTFACVIDTAHIDFSRLGGTQKLGKILTVLPTNNWPDIIKYISDSLPQYLHNIPEGKIKFGISAYGFGISPSKINASSLQIKKVIKSSKRGVRVVPNKETYLSTAQVLHNGLVSSMGIEILVIKAGRRTYLAQTTQVQDINAYAHRDQNRPMRDARVGMLPPKLAQIIINMATADYDPKYGGIVLDPFCGTGVILQEASLMGFDVAGSDLEPRMVEYTDKNMLWLAKINKNLAVASNDGRYYNLSQADATDHTWSPPPYCIAGETYLGRPLSSEPDHTTLSKIMNDCDTIHTKFLKNVASQTEPGFRMCIAVPAWKTRQGFKHLKTLDSLEKLGYNRLKFERVRDKDLIYHRKGQLVGRELVVLIRK